MVVATATADRIRCGRAWAGRDLRLTSCQLPFGLHTYHVRARAWHIRPLYLDCLRGRTHNPPLTFTGPWPRSSFSAARLVARRI